MKILRKFKSCLFFLFFIFSTVLSINAAGDSTPPTENFQFEYITMKDGLSQSSINCILQDSVGFLWFGTQDGLNRYDGYEFKIFKNQPFEGNSLSNNWIQTMVETEPGILWIGTWGEGLNRFDTFKNQVTRYRFTPGNPNGLRHNNIQALCKDTPNVLWIGARDGGLSRLDLETNTFTHYTHNPDDPYSLSHNEVTTIYKDADGALWVGSAKGLNRFDPQTRKFTRYFHNPGDPGSLSSNAVTAITGDRKGNLWIGTLDGGLDLYIPNKQEQERRFQHFKHKPNDPHSLCSNTISSILADSSGRVWIGTGAIEVHGSGVSRLTFNAGSGQWEIANYSGKLLEGTSASDTSPRLSDQTILSIAEDSGSNLWFGSFQQGLNKLSTQRVKFNHYFLDPDNPNSLNDNSILSIYEDEAGILWLGTFSGGLNRFDRKTNRFTYYKHNPNDPTSLSSNSIWKIFRDRSGTFWLGTGSEGINRFNPKTGIAARFKHDPDKPFSLSSNDITCLFEDSSGNLWIGAWGGGLNRLDRKTGRFYYYPFDPAYPGPHGTVIDIYEDKNKELWFCTFGQGLVKMNKTAGSVESSSVRFESYRHNQGDKASLSTDYLFTMLETENGDIWIGSNFGLNRFDRKTGVFTCFSETDGLSNNMVYGVIADGDNLWLSTNGGISQFNTRTTTFKNYDTGDGVQALEFNQGAFFKSRGGEIFFGGNNGFNAFFPHRVANNSHTPPIVITNFNILDSSVKLPGAAYALDRIRLSYQNRFFSIEFAALDFENPGKNRYAYKLEGFNKSWIQCGSRRFTDFTNLAGGEYIFRVKGCNNDGVWNEKGAAIRITIIPPFWMTWWFRSFIALLVVGLFLWLLHTRTQHLKHKMEEERLLNELKLKADFTAMLVHDLRSPLQCIIGYSDLLADERFPGSIPLFNERIKMSSSTMLNLINDMLDLSKFEAGQMVIHPEQTSLVDALNDNIRLIKPMLEHKQSRFELHLETLPPVLADPVRISQVVSNLLANAVKFSPDGSVITITARMVNEDNRKFQEVTVADQGPGIPPEKQEFLFSKYAQIEQKLRMPIKGTGLGLAVSRLIIEAHQGTIGYRPAVPGGSVFFFRIPSE